VQKRASLWQHRDFVKLWLGHTISVFGTRLDALTFVALITLAVTPAQLGLLGAVSSAPVLLVSLFAGVWVDRLRRRPILIASDIGRALLLGSIPLAALFGVLQLWQVYVVAALVGVLNVGFEVADHSYLPALVEREQLVEGNSKLSASANVMEIVAPGAGGGFVQLLTAPGAVLVDALTFLCSGLSVALIRKPEPPPAPRQADESIWRGLSEGLRVLFGNRLLRAIALSATMSNFFGAGFFGTLYTYYGLVELHLSPFMVGLIIGAGGVGGIIGALLAGPAVRRFGLGRFIVGGAFVASTLGILTPLASGPLPLVIILMLIPQLFGDLIDTAVNINLVSLRQSLVPHRLLGRVGASNNFLVGGAAPFGALTAGVLAQLITARYALLIAVIGMFLSNLWLLYSPLPNLREQPGEAQLLEKGQPTD